MKETEMAFGLPVFGADGIISIRRSPAKVIYIRWGEGWPAEPPVGENWLVPKNYKPIRVMHHPGSGLVLFYCIPEQGREWSHVEMVSKLVNEFNFSLPKYGEWVGFDSVRTRNRAFIKIDVNHLATEDVQYKQYRDPLKAGFRHFRATLERLKTLRAVPADYTVRMQLNRNKRTWTAVSDWLGSPNE